MGEIVPASPVNPDEVMRSLDSEPWFKRLSDDDQTTVKSEDQKLAEIYQYVGRSRLAAAERLTNIYKILGPLKVFERYIKRFHLKRRSAYRAIKAYQNVENLPKPILAVAMARNMPLMGETKDEPYGIYTAAIKKLPLPNESRLDESKAAEYLDMLEVKRKEIKPHKGARRLKELVEPLSARDLMQECYRYVDTRYRHLPDDWTKSQKKEWIVTLGGMLLKIADVSGEQLVPVIAPPDSFVAVRGRPRVH